MVLYAAAEFLAATSGVVQRGELGRDFDTYVRVAQHWIGTGSLYYPHQLAGPYPNTGDVNLYPPPTVLLFMPFLVLPAVLWWIVPLGVTAWLVFDDRPAWWSWPILAVAFVPLDFHAGIAMGNTTMWAVAAIALATRRPAAAVLLGLKPSFLPIALLYAVHRQWWRAALMMGAVALVFLPYWPAWWTAVGNIEGHNLLTYSLGSVPLLLVPIVAHLARTRSRRTLSGPHAMSAVAQSGVLVADPGSIPAGFAPSRPSGNPVH
jgi:hypothetical protein